MPPPPSYMSNTSGNSTNSQTSGIASQTEKNYNLYYPPIANSIISGGSSILDNSDNHTYITSGINSNYTSAVSITQNQTQTNYTVNTATSNNSGKQKNKFKKMFF